MDETKTRWFRWVADHAQYCFWGAWGAGLGAFLVTFTKGVDPDGSFTRFYLAVLSAIMGGVLGLVGARGMDRLADSRSIRRKANVARFKMGQLRRALERARNLDLPTLATQLTRDPAEAHVGYAFAAYRHILAAAENPPDFDDLMDTEEDFEVLAKARNAFAFSKFRFEMPSNIDTPDVSKARKFFAETLGVPGTVDVINRAIADLRNAEIYLVNRTRG